MTATNLEELEVIEKETSSEKWVFDATATQKIKIGDGVFAVLNAYTDTRAAKYEADLDERINFTQHIKLTTDDAKLEQIKLALELDSNLFDELCTTIEGETLPENWRSEIAVEDKAQILKTLTFVKILRDKITNSIFGKTNNIPVQLTFNGKFIEVECCLRKQTIEDSSSFNFIKSKRLKKVSAATKKTEAIYHLRSLRKDKCELFDTMFISQTGFKNGFVPAMVKEEIINYVFSSSVADAPEPDEVDEGK